MQQKAQRQLFFCHNPEIANVSSVKSADKTEHIYYNVFYETNKDPYNHTNGVGITSGWTGLKHISTHLCLDIAEMLRLYLLLYI